MDLQLEESSSVFSELRFQKLPVTSQLSALVKKEKEHLENHSTIRELLSTESLPDSWLKVEISQKEMAWEENQSTEVNSQMRTSTSSTPSHIFYRWPTLVQTPMDLNSSSPSLLPHG